MAITEAEGSAAGPLLRAINRIAAAVAGEFPEVAIDTLAYAYAQAPPKLTSARQNVIVRLCTNGVDLIRPLSANANAKFRAVLEGWSNKAGRLYLWHYVTDFGNMLQVRPALRQQLELRHRAGLQQRDPPPPTGVPKLRHDRCRRGLACSEHLGRRDLRGGPRDGRVPAEHLGRPANRPGCSSCSRTYFLSDIFPLGHISSRTYFLSDIFPLRHISSQTYFLSDIFPLALRAAVALLICAVYSALCTLCSALYTLYTLCGLYSVLCSQTHFLSHCFCALPSH